MYPCSGKRANGRSCRFVGKLKLYGRWYCRKHRAQGAARIEKIPVVELQRLSVLSAKDNAQEVVEAFPRVLSELLALRNVNPKAKE